MKKTRFPKTAKVISITEQNDRLIATDERTKRFILAVGNQRVAFDFLTRITELHPRTGDHPARVLSMEKHPELKPAKQR
jgi:hypothetical protein